jgi:hypothetical protein
MPDESIIMLQTVAKGLEELKDEVVFVGGAVAQMYVTDPAATDIRPTKDVDCVIELGTRLKYYQLEDLLRKKGFANDVSVGAPICRWLFKDIKVDVMPTDEKILGFSNLWYVEGISNKIVKTLPDGAKIFVFSPEYFLATKFEALKNRGSADLRQSHDFEDIIYVLDNNPQIPQTIKNAGTGVKKYLFQKFREILSNPNITEAIETALPYGSGDERTAIIKELLFDIVKD